MWHNRVDATSVSAATAVGCAGVVGHGYLEWSNDSLRWSAEVRGQQISACHAAARTAHNTSGSDIDQPHIHARCNAAGLPHRLCQVFGPLRFIHQTGTPVAVSPEAPTTVWLVGLVCSLDSYSTKRRRGLCPPE